MKALHLRILLSHSFSTFPPFHKLQFSSYIYKFGYIYVIGIKINKKPFHSIYFTEYSDPLSCLLRAPIYSGPNNSL